MAQALVQVKSAQVALLETMESAKGYGRAAKSVATRKAYASDLRDFAAFCGQHGLTTLPAEATTVGLYITALADRGLSVSTIRRRVAAIADSHSDVELPSPGAAKPVRAILAGISREKGVAPAKKAALTIDLVRQALDACRTDLHGLRDRAVILLGFHGALRRSELAALNVEDLAFERQGVVATIRRSKTDQEAAGYVEAADITTGPVFRTFDFAGKLQANRIDGRDVARIVQSAAKGAGLTGNMGGHSLRAGFVTSAAQANVAIDRIAQVSRHKSPAILLGYVRRARVFDDAPQLAIR